MSEIEQKSTFVNVVAWIFIVLGGFATFMTFLQNIMLYFFFPSAAIKQQMSNPDVAEKTPAFFQFMFSHFDLFFLFAFVMSLISFVSAIGLLKRKNWARIVFIILMAVGIIWNIGGLVLQFTIFPSMQEVAGQAPPPEFQTMQNIMLVASLIMVVAFSALSGWIIKKLATEPIVNEFA